MNLHEYQAKQLFARFGIPVSSGEVAESPRAARQAADRLGGSVWVVDYTMASDQGPPKDHRLAPEVIVGELQAVGLATKIDGALLPNQYVVIGTKADR